MIRRALRSAGGAINRNAYDLVAVASLISLCVGLAIIWVALAFIAAGVVGLLYVLRNMPPEPPAPTPTRGIAPDMSPIDAEA